MAFAYSDDGQQAVWC